MKNFLKSSEAITIFLGILLTFIYGRFWLIPMGIAYVLLNVPNAISALKSITGGGIKKPKKPKNEIGG